jgi:hypothetical protein
MATQYIDLQIGLEQTFQMDCNGTIYRFELFYDDFNTQWFVNVYVNSTDVPIIEGLYLLVNNNAFKFLEYLGIGTGLGLYDTDTTNTAAITKADLGDRVKLYREI